MIFIDKLNTAVGKNRSLVCVGLDTSPELIPTGMSVLEFNKSIIEATADFVCAYKPNIAFYEAQGEQGLDTLHKTINIFPPIFRLFWMQNGVISATPLPPTPKRCLITSAVMRLRSAPISVMTLSSHF